MRSDSSNGDLRHPYQASQETSLTFADRDRVQNDLRQSVGYLHRVSLISIFGLPTLGSSLLFSAIYPIIGIPHHPVRHLRRLIHTQLFMGPIKQIAGAPPAIRSLLYVCWLCEC